jgi:hypothetical protein
MCGSVITPSADDITPVRLFFSLAFPAHLTDVFFVRAERFLHLVTFREGGKRAFASCPCGVSHREYIKFPSISGQVNFEAKMRGVLNAMGDVIQR